MDATLDASFKAELATAKAQDKVNEAQALKKFKGWTNHLVHYIPHEANALHHFSGFLSKEPKKSSSAPASVADLKAPSTSKDAPDVPLQKSYIEEVHD